MYNPEASPSRSLDVAGTPTVNTARHCNPNCRLRLNAKVQPIAVRRFVTIGQPGSFATQRYEAILPHRVVSLSHSMLPAWEKERSHPVN